MNLGCCTYYVLNRRLCLFAFSILSILTAQAQVGKVGINTDTPLAMLHVKDSSVVFTGPSELPFPPGNPPVNGAGIRMMWYPEKAAFRAGHVSGTQWNKDSIGVYSYAQGYNARAFGQNAVAMGYNTKADGHFSIALGSENITSGQQSIALGTSLIASDIFATAIGVGNDATGRASLSTGSNCLASAEYATAMGHINTSSGYASFSVGEECVASGFTSIALGDETKAIGDFSTALGAFTMSTGTTSTAMGAFTKAKGNRSTAIGSFTMAKPFAAVALGQYNDTSSISSTTWDLNDPLFIVGNGTADNARKNAMTILKNGKTGINTITPGAMLHVVKDGSTNGPYHSSAAAIVESSQSSYIQFSNPNNIQSGILSGNEETSIRSALLFGADSSILFRAGGNINRVAIKNGNVGINTISPQRLLHVSAGVGGSLYNSNAEVILEDNDDTYLQFSSPTSQESGILSVMKWLVYAAQLFSDPIVRFKSGQEVVPRDLP